MNDREIIDTLNEAARYMRTRPDVSRELIVKAMVGFPIGSHSGTHRKGHRLYSNLYYARVWAVVEPDVAAGYCRGAAFEIQATGGEFTDG